MRKSLSFLFVFLVLLLLLSGIAAAGFWQDVTGDIVRSFKTSSYANDLTLASSTRIIQNAEYFLNNYPSLANVKTKITSMGGLAALEEVFASYNPYESISTKERKFNEIFRRYPLINEEDRIYIVHLAHALWIEKNNVVPWSLRDYNADKITALLERGWAIEELANRRFEDTVIQRASSAWEYGNISKDWYKLYPLTMNIINGSGNQLTAASLIIEWAEKNFFDALEMIGYEVKSKDLQIFYGGNKKGDWDIGIAMDTIELAQKLDTIVLVSGDGDFIPLVEYLKWGLGRTVEVAAFDRTASSKLEETADSFIDLGKTPGVVFKVFKKTKK